MQSLLLSFILVLFTNFYVFAEKKGHSVPEPLYLKQEITSKIFSTPSSPLFALSSDGCMLLTGVEEGDVPCILKVDATGKLLWKVIFNKNYKPTGIAAGLDGGAVLALSNAKGELLFKSMHFSGEMPTLSNDIKENYSQVVFLDKGGEQKAVWKKTSKLLSDIEIFDLQTNVKGEVLFLFRGHIVAAKEEKGGNYISAACLDSQGTEKWLIEPKHSVYLDKASFCNEGIGLVDIHQDFVKAKNIPPVNFYIGWSANSNNAPVLQLLQIDKTSDLNWRLDAFIGSMERNAFFYMGFSDLEEQEIKNVDLLDKRGPQIKTLLKEPIYQAKEYGGVYTNPVMSYWPPINLQIISLPGESLAILDGSISARVRLLDSKSRVFNQYEITGMGVVSERAFFYDEKRNAMHVMGVTSHQKRGDRNRRTVFWSQVHFQ